MRSYLNNFISIIRLFYYNLRYPHCNFGQNITFFGDPLFVLKGQCELGNNIVFTSSRKSNMAGITKKCSICVLPEAKLSIGENSGFSGISIFCANSIRIGKFCNFGVNTFIWDTDFHSLEYRERRTKKEKIKTKPIVIGNDVFIGANTIILKGVTIGDNVIIGAGSVITKDIPANQVWDGNPIRYIRDN